MASTSVSFRVVRRGISSLDHGVESTVVAGSSVVVVVGRVRAP